MDLGLKIHKIEHQLQTTGRNLNEWQVFANFEP